MGRECSPSIRETPKLNRESLQFDREHARFGREPFWTIREWLQTGREKGVKGRETVQNLPGTVKKWQNRRICALPTREPQQACSGWIRRQCAVANGQSKM